MKTVSISVATTRFCLKPKTSKATSVYRLSHHIVRTNEAVVDYFYFPTTSKEKKKKKVFRRFKHTHEKNKDDVETLFYY